MPRLGAGKERPPLPRTPAHFSLRSYSLERRQRQRHGNRGWQRRYACGAVCTGGQGAVVQEAQSALALPSHVPDMYRHRDDERVSVMILPADLHTEQRRLCYRFDSSMMNGLQAVPTWDACEWHHSVQWFAPCSSIVSLRPSKIHDTRPPLCTLLPRLDMLSSIRPLRHGQVGTQIRHRVWERNHDHRCCIANIISGLCVRAVLRFQRPG